VRWDQSQGCRSALGLAAIVACAVSACGPNAARVASGGSTPLATVTPASWKPVPTATQVPAWAVTPTARPVEFPTNPAVPPTAMPPPAPTSTGGRPAQAGLAQTATPALPPRPFPTPTPGPPAECRFAGGVVTVPVQAPVSGGITPGVVPSFFQGTPGWTTVSKSEPMPGVVLELRLPGTTFVEGGVVSPEVKVQNGTTADISVVTNVVAMTDNRQPIAIDERSVLNGGAHSRPYDPGRVVPAGQTWSLPTTVQLPFEAASAVHLVASAAVGRAGVSSPGASAVAQYTDIPLNLTAARPGEQLQIQLQVDRRQWCMRATTVNGGVPVGPLFVSMQAVVAGGGRSFLDPARIDGNTWAGYWNSTLMQSPGHLSVSIWVGGANYATTRADASVP
jgi:hypothetical protein